MFARNRKILCSFLSSVKNHYQVLGVSQSASQQQIKSAYYQLAKIYHPDVTPNSAEKFREITQAYNTLKNPIKRKELDQKLEPVSPKYKPAQNFTKSGFDFNKQFRYDYPSNYDHLQRNFNRNYARRRQFMNQMRRNYYQQPNVGFRFMHLFGLGFLVFFGFIISLQMLVNFYRLTEMEKQRMYYSNVLYDLEAEEEQY